MTDSTQLSINSSVFSLRSAETVPTPLTASPVIGRSPLASHTAANHEGRNRGSFTGGNIATSNAMSSSSVADGPTSPSIAASMSIPPSSAFSSPRTTKAELGEGVEAPLKVPSLQPGLSWANIAGNTDGLAKMITDVASHAAAKKKNLPKETPTKDIASRVGGPRKQVRA